MQLDIYRDQALEKLLIVEKGQDIHKLSIDDPAFLRGLEPTRTIDPEFGGFPTGISKDKVLEQIRQLGYFKETIVFSLREIEG